jgi:site-specific DNA-methyltransferase (adenine-specific)
LVEKIHRAPLGVLEMTPSALVICSDCLAGLRDLPDDSIDAVVTDPPSGIAFMGADWDKDKGGRDAWIDWLAEIMREVWRVTKPGGHALVWALPRTQHWTATAVENAGWEVRDVLMHVFGSGFPKSSNVSIQIDKQAGAMGHRGKAHHGHATGEVANGRENLNAPHAMPEHKGITPEAKRWAGWGTALKPSHEAWILARKPLSGTVAATVLEHGTGALNIDGCRVGTDAQQINAYAGRGPFGDSQKGKEYTSKNVIGRWPPHLLLSHAAACGETCADGCPVAEMDAQSGVLKAGIAGPKSRVFGDGIIYGTSDRKLESESTGYGDTGGASRFFPVFRYVAKPSTAEKSAGLGHRTPATGGEATGRKDGSAGLDNPRAGAGRNGGALNIHPTVKPRGLMEWLVKLITPPGGVVLDPFTGSGSTGVAAVGLGFDFIGFEMSEEFAGIARDRIGHAVAGVEIETVGIEDYEPKPEATGQGRLF